MIFHAYAATPSNGAIVSGFWGYDPPKFCYIHRNGWSILQQGKMPCDSNFIYHAGIGLHVASCTVVKIWII